MDEINKINLSEQGELRLDEIKKLKIISSMGLMKRNCAVKN